MTAPFRLLIPRPIFEAMLSHAQAELPAECCGLLAGTVAEGIGRVTQHFPLVNALTSPTEFESEPRSMFTAHKAMRMSETTELAVYHSHPSTDPIPSQHDLDHNYSVDIVNIIIGLRKAEPDVRAWWLIGDVSSEASWEIEDSTGPI